MKIYLLTILLIVSAFSFGQSSVPEDDSLEYTIPVVVHIMNPEKGSNLVSPIQVQYAIDYLNLVFGGKYPGMEPHTDNPDIAAAGDIGIRFELAKQTPDGQPSTGIDIKDASGLPDYTENGVDMGFKGGMRNSKCQMENIVYTESEKKLKAFAYWQTTQYLNIWIVHKIGNRLPNELAHEWNRFKDKWTKLEEYKHLWADLVEWLLLKTTEGESSIPDLGIRYTTPELDGVVVSPSALKNLSILAHEIGHYLNLLHVFAPTLDLCNTKDPFLEGDRVLDTDKFTDDQLKTQITDDCKNLTGKPYRKNTVHNFMSYYQYDCRSLFTNGQKNRMRECIRSYRQELVRTYKNTSDSNTEENNLRRFGNAAVSRDGEKLIFRLKSENSRVLVNNLTEGDGWIKYIFIGYSNDLNSFIVENVGYESSNFSLINRNNGAETIVPDINFKILPSKKWVVFYNEEGDESGIVFTYSEDGLEPVL